MNVTPRQHTNAFWNRRIDAAVGEPDAGRSNALITAAHRDFGRVLGKVLGGGPNFHTWAVWGSSKAGETIRGEGNERAERELPVLAGVVGLLIGLAAGSPILAVAVALIGAVAVRVLIHLGARRAAGQVLAGNRLVLADIGRVTARYLALFRFDRYHDERKLNAFLRSLPDHQHLLRSAFACYHRARFTRDSHEQARLMWEGNCLAVLHEHHKLQPCIAGATPWGLRRYVTARLLKYRVGGLNLSVSTPLSVDPRFTTTEPAILEHLATGPTVRATNWADLPDRMRYVFALFAAYHAHPEVVGENLVRNREFHG
jgi:hypothetical protein